MSYLATVPTVNLELRENIQLVWHPSAPPFGSARHAPVGLPSGWQPSSRELFSSWKTWRFDTHSASCIVR